MMRLLVHCTEYGPPWNEGTKLLARAFVAHARARGHAVVVAARSVTSEATDAVEIGGGRLSPFALVGAVARAHRIDVVHSIQSLSSLTGARCAALRRASGARLLLHVTGLGPTLAGHRWGAHADRVVVGSPYLTRYFAQADIVFPLPGVDDTRPLSPPRHTDEPVIAFLGAFEPGRGVDTLLAACALLRATGVRFRLQVAWNGVGGDDGRSRVMATARHHGIPLDVAGTVDVRAFYQTADVVVIPRAARTRMSLPLRVVECALLQRPVVVPRLLGMDAVVGDMGGAFAPGDAGSLADALRPLLLDAARRDACRTTAAHRRAEFLPEVSLGRLDRVYAALGS